MITCGSKTALPHPTTLLYTDREYLAAKIRVYQAYSKNIKLDTFSWQNLTNALSNFDFLTPEQGQSESCNYIKCMTIE